MLILGGAGSVGSAAVQIASHRGAVIRTADSTANLEPLRRLGAAHPFDYRRQEFTHDRARYGVIMKAASPSEVFFIN